MNKTMKVMFGLLIVFIPTLQVSAQESKSAQFKRELLSEIKNEIKDLSDEEIRKIIDAVEQNLTEYVEHYEDATAAELLTKDQKLLQQQQGDDAMAQPFNMLLESQKPQEQIVFEQLQPKLELLPEGKIMQQGDIGLTAASMNQRASRSLNVPQSLESEAWRWALLSKGDVLVNLDNGMFGFKWGHVGMMYDKAHTPEQSRTIEILGFGDVVQFKNYKTTWHDNHTDRISHNYVTKAWGTNIPEKAADYATRWLGKGYSIWPVLGDTSSFYCTELVFMAYKAQGVNLGNGMDTGSLGILMPKSMYCSSELSSYYRQNMSGRAGNVC